MSKYRTRISTYSTSPWRDEKYGFNYQFDFLPCFSFVSISKGEYSIVFQWLFWSIDICRRIPFRFLPSDNAEKNREILDKIINKTK